ncbi:MAG: SusF/SusE family outer membrane protein [Prevotella sp.]|jgi:hypothetical protein|nr:SusF/SusE family outer membrane protein [Prevotella sp.]
MKTIYRILFLSVSSVFFFACGDDVDSSFSGAPLQLTTSADTLVLLEENANDMALTFSWNKGIDRPSCDTVSYIYRLDISTGDFETTSTPPDTIDDFTKSYTAIELNELIMENWGVFAGEEAILKARVVAKVNGPKFVYPEIATVSVVVKTYAPASRPLYLAGTATAAGTDPSRAIRLNETSNGKLYNWKGNLTVGNFKFLTSTESILPSLNKGRDSNTLVERNNAGDPDDCFEITKEGSYYIGLNTRTMKIYYGYYPFETVYIVGNATSAEWDIDNSIPMTWSPEKPSIFTARITLKEGELKLPVVKSWSDYNYRPLVADGSIESTDVQVYSGGDDKKWKVNANQAGDYLITLDTYNMKIYFEKQ